MQRKPINPLSFLNKMISGMDEQETIICRTMKMLELEPECCNQMSGELKTFILFLRATPMYIRACKQNRVPKQYIRFFNHSLSEFYKNNYIDKNHHITLYEYATTVMGFNDIISIDSYMTFTEIGNKPELLEKIHAAFVRFNEQGGNDLYYHKLNQHVMMLCLYVSQPHYRLYSFSNADHFNDTTIKHEKIYEIQSLEPERKQFVFAGSKHLGYRLWHYDVFANNEAPVPVMTFIDPEKAGLPAGNPLPVYIQVHALNRMDERLDIYDKLYRNLILCITMRSPEFVCTPKGDTLLAVTNVEGIRVGYFPFVVVNNELLIRSFIPLSSPVTPEGALLFRQLKLKITDSTYLHMDKLSFYTQTDFEHYPELKTALQAAGMDALCNLNSSLNALKSDNISLRHFFGPKTKEQPTETGLK